MMTCSAVSRVCAIAAGILAALWLLASSALAAQDRVVVEEGSDPVDRAALVGEVENAQQQGLILSVSVLAGEPPAGAEAEADRLVDQAGGAALVITPTEVGGVSDAATHDTAGAVDAALDRLASGDDIVAATSAFTDDLLRSGDADGGVPGVDAVSGSGVDLPIIGRISFGVVIALVIGLVLLRSVFRILGRSGRRGGRGYSRHRGRRGGMLPGAAIGYGVGRSRRNRRSGAAGSTSTRASTTRSSGGASRGRSSGGRSRSSGSRGGRSRSSGRRR